MVGHLRALLVDVRAEEQAQVPPPLCNRACNLDFRVGASCGVGLQAAQLVPYPCWHAVSGHGPRDALEGKGPQRRPQKRLGRRLEGVARAVGGGYCRLQMPLSLALGVRGTVAGHRLRAVERGGGGPLRPF